MDPQRFGLTGDSAGTAVLTVLLRNKSLSYPCTAGTAVLTVLAILTWLVRMSWVVSLFPRHRFALII